MSKTKHLDKAIDMLRRPALRPSGHLRPLYEEALRKQGWKLTDSSGYASEWHRKGNRMIVYNGDKVAISFAYEGVRWHFLNQTARQKLLLPSQ